MQNSNTYTLHVIALHCFRQEEQDGDEVFINYKKERIWPLNDKFQKVTEGDYDVKVDVTGIENGEIVHLELWDYDLLSANDKLGIFSLLINERGGPFRTDLHSRTGSQKYTLEWEVY